MPQNNKAGGYCIRCEAWTKSYIGIRVNGRVLCKHCAKAPDEPMEEAIGDGPV